MGLYGHRDQAGRAMNASIAAIRGRNCYFLDDLHTGTDMTRNKLLLALTILGLASCDPVHQLKLDNETTKPVVVIYSPLIDNSPTGSKIESFDVNGVTYAKTVLDSGQVMRIGNVVARYNPRPDDVELDFLEVRIGNDTMKLIGKKSIFSAIQKVDKLDWRLIIKDK